jgi:predicted DCC family thiol-disulfide oxidoreductase YuxK
MTSAPYSYRSDSTVPAFADDAAVLFFDGVCVLCSRFACHVLRHDTNHRIRLCAAQSALGQATYKHYGLDPVVFTTNILLSKGVPFFKSEAFIETMSLIGGLSSTARLLRLRPQGLRDMLYDPIARNRYAWFGERNVCYMPTPDERDRVLS